MYEIRIAITPEIPQVHELLSRCGMHMYETMKLTHWYPYKTLPEFTSYMNGKTIYCIHEGSSLLGSFNLDTRPRDYYYAELWSDGDCPALYLGNLGILPQLQNRGLGKRCMSEVERIAKEQKRSIRFDCVEKHPWLAGFYEKLGYKRRETIPSSVGNLICFEKTVEAL